VKFHFGNPIRNGEKVEIKRKLKVINEAFFGVCIKEAEFGGEQLFLLLIFFYCHPLIDDEIHKGST
jgi:hypothetical protein